MKPLTLPFAFLIALAACDNSTPDTQPANTTTIEPTDATAPAASGTTSAQPSPMPSAIPAAIQGRWGLGPADCDPARDDAKGLLTIGPDTLEFYESVGTLAQVEEASDTRIRASFAFTGEGMTWQRDETLDLQDGGQTLIRREYGEDAAPAPFRYSKCR